MQYELECGYCGYQFVLGATALPRSVQCSVCGGRLTLAVPVPVPPAEPRAPARAPTEPEPEPHAPPVVDEEGDEEDEPARRELAEPWPIVRDWLNTARTATEFGRVLCALAVCLDLFVCSFAPDVRESAVVRSLTMTGATLLIPAILHIGSQLVVTQTPPAYGGNRAGLSVGLLCSVPVLAGAARVFATDAAKLPDEAATGITAAVTALMACVAFAVWVTFLARLGRSLGDDALADGAGEFHARLLPGFVLAATFLTGAYVAERAGAGPLVWLGRAATAAVLIVSLRRYAALLRLAVGAVERRAPAAR